MDDQSKDHDDPEELTQRNRPKQLQTHNLPTEDVESINRTNKRKDLLLAISRGLFPEELKEYRKWFIGTRELLYIEQHILNTS